MPQVSLLSGTAFTVPNNISILDGAIKVGVLLPYSCKTGRCSTCKCKVLSGETRELHSETGLTKQEKAAGWILSCVRSAVTDLTLEVNDLREFVLPAVKTIPCRISHLKLLAPDVIQVKLRLPPNTKFSFIPGQYIDVIDLNGNRRSYSLANANFADKFLELHIRAVEGGAMSEYWFKQAKVNDLLRLNGPLGTFFLRDIANKDLVFLATGTGIGPIKAMLESLSTHSEPKSVTVLWGGRSPNDLYFNITTISDKFNYTPVLSRADSSWLGARGHVQTVLLANWSESDFSNAAVYACGSNAMIHSAKEILEKNGLPPNNFYSDAFVCSSTESV